VSFDEQTGVLVAQGGLSLSDVLAVFVPRGWFAPVTPGTRFVTLAGLVAADAHGKNHHVAGSFGDHVLWFDLACADGELRRCSVDQNAELFRATIGGMGLTGHIMTVCLGLMPIPSAYMTQRTIAAGSLEDAMQAFEDNLDVPYSVAWIDCLATGASRGRSLVMLADHATPDQLNDTAAEQPFALPRRPQKTMPIDAPSWALNKYSIRLFNRLYYGAGARKTAPEIVDYDRFFYPLDAIHDWNRLYGRNGFAQYQCALPLATSRDGLLDLLDVISSAGAGSFLAVLKRFGPGAPDRPLSFPMEGYTLALDFALTPATLTLFDRLDEIVVRNKGRLYLSKDSRMTQTTFNAGYGDAADQFRDLRQKTGAAAAFQSLLSERLGL
jgi:FAD/FMN-containing dehydrogenase